MATKSKDPESKDPKGTALTSVQERIAAQLAAQTKEAAQLQQGGNFITFKGAVLRVNDQVIPGNSAEVRVLAVIYERAWYDGPYDPDTPQIPACFSIGDSGKPHENSRAIQNDICMTCPKNQWGSAAPRPGATTSRGKACRESARVMVCPANLPLESAPVYMAKVPITSMKTVNAFTDRCNQLGKLYGQFVVQLSVADDKRSIFKVHLDVKELDEAVDLEALLGKMEAAHEEGLKPYPVMDEAE